MAKEKAAIVGSVRLGGTVYKEGMEEELAKELTAAQIERLSAAGVIAGFDAKAAKAEAPKETAKEPAKEADKDPKK